MLEPSQASCEAEEVAASLELRPFIAPASRREGWDGGLLCTSVESECKNPAWSGLSEPVTRHQSFMKVSGS